MSTCEKCQALQYSVYGEIQTTSLDSYVPRQWSTHTNNVNKTSLSLLVIVTVNTYCTVIVTVNTYCTLIVTVNTYNDYVWTYTTRSYTACLHHSHTKQDLLERGSWVVPGEVHNWMEPYYKCSIVCLHIARVPVCIAVWWTSYVMIALLENGENNVFFLS